MINFIFLFERGCNYIKSKYRNYIFRCRTGQRANLIGDITLINKNIRLGKNVTIYPYCQFWGDGLINIGDNVDIGTGTILYASQGGGIQIGNNTSIAGQCYIIDMDHGELKNQLIQKQRNIIKKVIIGDDCWLAANVTVLKGSIIGDGVIIGAKGLVNGNVSNNSISVGIPSKVIKTRSETGGRYEISK